MAQIWNPTNTQAHDTVVQVDVTSGLVTPVVARPTGATTNLNVTAASASTGSAMNEGVYLITNSVYTRVEFSDVSGTADQTHTLLAPGERLLVIPNQFVNVIKATGSVDGVFSMTRCE